MSDEAPRDEGTGGYDPSSVDKLINQEIQHHITDISISNNNKDDINKSDDLECVEGVDGEEHEGDDELLSEETLEVDLRSVYVGNVDYNGTPEELQDHFKSCGGINRITILVDRHTGKPKGFAYVEFSDPCAVENAVLMNDTMMRGRLLKVTRKRTNLHGFNRARMRVRRRGRGRGSYVGGGGYMIHPRPPFPGYRPFMPRYRGRGFRPY
eukprot:GHVR01017396.1.p1 GENE.GHVR01017396.1~~GHVR01017396.1.p1  ORF type:complete len:210 (+),score=61.30 GHVR01017396.1:86-715(+)